MQPFIQIFGLAISAAPAAVWLGFVLAIWLAGRTAAWRGLDGRLLGDALTVAGFAALLGARLGYVALHVSVYVRDPLAALALSTSALDGAFGALAGVGALAWRLHRAGMLRWAAADALAPPALVLGMGFALASYFDGAVFGAVAEVPWAVEVWGAARHPVQFYEMAGLLIILAATVVLRKRALPDGALALGTVLAYGLLRLIVDGFRADEAALLVGLRASQIVAAVCAALAAWGLGEAARDYGGDATGRI
jgi:phosphatidylglycerol:prolipoprotein diacylglycerol transferase